MDFFWPLIVYWSTMKISNHHIILCIMLRKMPHHLVQHGVPFDHDCIERPVRVPASEAAVVGTGEAVRHGPTGCRLDGVSFAVEGVPVPAPIQRIRAAEIHVGMIARFEGAAALSGG